MASAASLLTPHMLTEAYTSLLAALTVWNPAERRTDTSDGDRQAGDTYRAFPTGTFRMRRVGSRICISAP